MHMKSAECDANAKMTNASYIPPACVGIHVGLIGTQIGLIGTHVGSARLFGYQHVGIGNAIGV